MIVQFRALSRRMNEHANERVIALLDRVELAWSKIGGARVVRDENKVIIAARGLRRAQLADVRLRFVQWSSQ